MTPNPPLTSEDIQARSLAIQVAGTDLEQAAAVYDFLTTADPRPSAPTLHISRDEKIRQQFHPTATSASHSRKMVDPYKAAANGPDEDGTRTDTTPNYLHPSYGPKIASAFLALFRVHEVSPGVVDIYQRGDDSGEGFTVALSLANREQVLTLALASAQADLLYGK